MKALIFILTLALMPTIFKAQQVQEKPPEKIKMVDFKADSFSQQVDSTLYYVKTDSTKTTTAKPKPKTRKQQGKTPLLLELGKYAIGLVLSFFLACPK